MITKLQFNKSYVDMVSNTQVMKCNMYCYNTVIVITEISKILFTFATMGNSS